MFNHFKVHEIMKRFLILAISAMAMLLLGANTASAQYIGAEKSLRGQGFSFDKNQPPLDINHDDVCSIAAPGVLLDDSQLLNLFGENEFNHFKRNRTAYRVVSVWEKALLLTMIAGGALTLYSAGEAMFGKQISWDSPELKYGLIAFGGGAAATFVTVIPIKEYTIYQMKGVVKRYNKNVPITRLGISATQNGVGLTMNF